MLLNSFFTIQSVEKKEEQNASGILVTHYHMDAAIDQAHPIFLGHFPGNPVVPGVCQVQMVTESVQRVMGQQIFLEEADNIKFLSMINPVETKILFIDLAVKKTTDERLSVQAGLSDKDHVFFKFKGIFSTRTKTLFVCKEREPYDLPEEI